MAKRSLYKTSQQARKILFGFVVFIVIVMAADLIIKASEQTIDPFFADGTFYLERTEGDIIEVPELPLTSLPIDSDSNPTFLVEGVFPQHPDAVYVHNIESPRVRLNYEANAVRTATALGFVPGNNYTSLNGDRRTDLLWENFANTRTLKYNAEELSWLMRTQYFLDQPALQPKILLPSENAYTTVAQNILRGIGLNSGKGLGNATVRTTYAELGNDGFFTNPINQNNANYVSINIFRNLEMARLKDDSEWPFIPDDGLEPPEFNGLVYKQDPREGSVKMIVGDDGGSASRDVYEFDFVDYNYQEPFVIRNIISPEEAWNEIRQGNGKLRLLKYETADYFADSQVLGVDTFVLNAFTVELAYYEPETWDGFVYPIYIMRGRAELSDGLSGDFVFYMDALERDVLEVDL